MLPHSSRKWIDRPPLLSKSTSPILICWRSSCITPLRKWKPIFMWILRIFKLSSEGTKGIRTLKPSSNPSQSNRRSYSRITIATPMVLYFSMNTLARIGYVFRLPCDSRSWKKSTGPPLAPHMPGSKELTGESLEDSFGLE